jgi:hypothetical protein
MAPGKIPHSSERAHEMHKVGVLADYARYCETHESEADTRAVMAIAQRCLQKAERA